MKEYIVSDFLTLKENDEKLKGYDACFFCAGVSSIGMKEAKYTRNTYDTTLTFAKATGPNPQMSFVYVSGGGTDSSEKGRLMWARVKGKTENDLMKLPFRKVYAFRPGYMQPTPGLKNANKLYFLFSWLYPVWRRAFPKFVTTLAELGLAMINVVLKGYSKTVIEVADIKILAKM